MPPQCIHRTIRRWMWRWARVCSWLLSWSPIVSLMIPRWISGPSASPLTICWPSETTRSLERPEKSSTQRYYRLSPSWLNWTILGPKPLNSWKNAFRRIKVRDRLRRRFYRMSGCSRTYRTGRHLIKFEGPLSWELSAMWSGSWRWTSFNRQCAPISALYRSSRISWKA